MTVSNTTHFKGYAFGMTKIGTKVHLVGQGRYRHSTEHAICGGNVRIARPVEDGAPVPFEDICPNCMTERARIKAGDAVGQNEGRSSVALQHARATRDHAQTRMLLRLR